MNQYLKPAVFWALESFGAFLFMLMVADPDMPIWLPFLLGILLVSAIIEWGVEQQWKPRVQLYLARLELRQLDKEIVDTREDISAELAAGDTQEAASLRAWLQDCHYERVRVCGKIAGLRLYLGDDPLDDALDHSINGTPLR